MWTDDNAYFWHFFFFIPHIIFCIICIWILPFQTHCTLTKGYLRQNFHTVATVKCICLVSYTFLKFENPCEPIENHIHTYTHTHTMRNVKKMLLPFERSITSVILRELSEKSYGRVSIFWLYSTWNIFNRSINHDFNLFCVIV